MGMYASFDFRAGEEAGHPQGILGLEAAGRSPQRHPASAAQARFTRGVTLSRMPN